MTRLRVLSVFCVIALSVTALTLTGKGKTEPISAVVLTPTPTPEPTAVQFKSYRGVAIGMSAEQARQKLGTPKERSNSGDYYVISQGESVQLIFEKDLTIKSLTVNYTGDLKGAPSPKDVFGVDVKKEPDGSITKMVSFPKDGYWASFVRTGGKDAMIIVTLQKLAEQ